MVALSSSRRGLFPALLICLCLSASPATRAGEPVILVLNDVLAPPWTTAAGDGFLDIVVGEAFRRAGFRLQLVRLPPERGLINANAGIEDGELMRPAGMEKDYPNLLRVPEKVSDAHFVAFVKGDKLSKASWIALEPLSVGYITGWKSFEQMLTPHTQRTTAENAEQLFTMLEKGRIDAALYGRWLGYALIKERGLRDVHVVEPPLAVRETYIYLHKRHADKVQAIAAALRAIKAEGLYRKACKEKFSPLALDVSPCDSQ